MSDNPTSIKQAINKIAKGTDKSVCVEEGIVKSASPLKITLTNDSKMTLTGVDLIVPRNLTEHSEAIVIDGITKTITVKNSIKTGDKVHLLVFNNGKRYYILDKT